jgi:hypothetical protein
MENKLDFWTRRLFSHVSQSQILYPLIWGKNSYPLKSSVDQKQGEKCSRSENGTPPLKLLSYQHFVFIMLTGFAVVTVGARVLAESTVVPFDPFSAYADIFPGQSMTAVKARGLLCRDVMYQIHEEVCTLTTTSGDITGVNVTISTDIIRLITFTMRENSLNVGDLLLLTGVRNFNTYPEVAFFFSIKGLIIAYTGPVAKPFLFRPVRTVSFEYRSVSK